MQRSDFSYELPPDLIAQQPPAERGGSRLLCLDGRNGALTDQRFSDLPAWLRPGDTLIFNDTRVVPARLLGNKDSGGQVEVLLERILDEHRVLAQVRASKSPKPGSWLELHGARARVEDRDGEFFILHFDGSDSALNIFERLGAMPLPPYIERQPSASDAIRYQTVFARVAGAVAAPTAGLHFSTQMLALLQSNGIEIDFVTLHVGAGTFAPMRVDELDKHKMHKEWLEVSPSVVATIERTRQRRGRVIAVGTTVVRALETAARTSTMLPFAGETEIFIYPGFEFNAVDALVTNFHLPQSTLLMLVSAYGGIEHIKTAYRHAVNQRYRFFSYGDAMFITPCPTARKYIYEV